MKKNVSVFCGWGRVIMAQTFSDLADLVATLSEENSGERDIATYVTKPHLALSFAPQQLFLDPSDMMRLDLQTYPHTEQAGANGLAIRPVASAVDAQSVNTLYLSRGMVPSNPDFIWRNARSSAIIFLVAEDTVTKKVIGTVMGLNHSELFDEPEKGASLWCLAVDPEATRPGVGEALVRHLAGILKNAQCRHLDLSVIYDNRQAKALYKKIGFTPQPKYFSVKNKNAHNQALFIGPEFDDSLNPYAKIIVDEARSRGITVDILDAEEGYFELSRGGKSIVCRESLSELTSAIAMSRCQDKYVTHRWLNRANLKTPAFQLASDPQSNSAFLQRYGSIVVKPAIGEQGKGISVGVEKENELEDAITKARTYSERVLLESFHSGEDLRVVLINYRVVAAAIRRPATIIGDGNHDAKTLIEKQSRRRQAATNNESSIPIDQDTMQCLAKVNASLDTVIPSGDVITVRKTANLHTGGTIHDVTDILHPALVEASKKAAKQLETPVVGLDFIIKAPDQPEHIIIEANERVGLANHEPHPTAQRFVDLLFPLSATGSWQRPG